MEPTLNVENDPDGFSLHGVNDLFLHAIRSAAAQERIQLRECECHISGILAPTEEGMEYVSMRLHVRLRVDGADVGRVDGLIKSAQREMLRSGHVSLPIQVSTTVNS